MSISLGVPFFIAAVTALFCSAVAPWLHLIAFAPLLALASMRHPLLRALWISLACGLIVDFLSSEMHFGFYCLNYSAVTLLIHRFKRYFFEEKWHALALFTLLFSWLSSTIELFLLFASHTQSLFSLRILVTDLLVMPLCDALYGFLFFTCSMKFIEKYRKTSFKEFFSKGEEG